MTSELKQMSESLHHVDLSRACFRWKQVSWTQALRTIVKNCYKQHGREDLLYAFEDHITTQHITTTTTHSIAHLVPSQTVVQTISNPDGTVSLIQVSSGPSCGNSLHGCFSLWYKLAPLEDFTTVDFFGASECLKFSCIKCFKNLKLHKEVLIMIWEVLNLGTERPELRYGWMWWLNLKRLWFQEINMSTARLKSGAALLCVLPLPGKQLYFYQTLHLLSENKWAFSIKLLFCSEFSYCSRPVRDQISAQ